MRNQALEDQIYEQKHKIDLISRDLKRYEDENEMLKQQMEHVKMTTEETIKEVRD